ncbi:hypothetical protein BsWGS_28770 [Bradybaena similaris]
MKHSTFPLLKATALQMGDKNRLSCCARLLETDYDTQAGPNIGRTPGSSWNPRWRWSSCTVAKFFPRKAITVWFLAWERKLDCLWNNPCTRKVISPLTPTVVILSLSGLCHFKVVTDSPKVVVPCHLLYRSEAYADLQFPVVWLHDTGLGGSTNQLKLLGWL